MKKILLYLIIFLIPVLNPDGKDEPVANAATKGGLYEKLNLGGYGLSNEAFQLACKGYAILESEGKLTNPDVLTIIDFSQSSTKKRLFVIDLKTDSLLFNTFVAHGRNTGDEFATSFSNESGTHKSSLGFYITEGTAIGNSVGLSLIISGIEKGINDKAEERAIIIHGADYATEDFIRKTGRLGRSFGCPTLPPDVLKPVIESIKNGSCLFIYYPDNDYLSHSPLLASHS